MNCFLVYRPVMGYEESEEPYFVCATRRVALGSMAKMQAFMDRLLTRLPAYPLDEDDLAGWEKCDDRRRKMLSKARWPFGVNLSAEIEPGNSWDSGSVAVRELPFIPIENK